MGIFLLREGEESRGRINANPRRRSKNREYEIYPAGSERERINPGVENQREVGINWSHIPASTERDTPRDYRRLGEDPEEAKNHAR